MRQLLSFIGGVFLLMSVGVSAEPLKRQATYNALVYTKDIKTGKVGTCSGTLVASGWILTAKHCVTVAMRNPDKKVLKVGLGISSGNFSKAKFRRNATKIVHYPGAADIALVAFEPSNSEAYSPVVLLNTVWQRKNSLLRGAVLGLGIAHGERSFKNNNKTNKNIRHLKGEGGRPGVAGFSGGGFVALSETFGHVQFAVNHGGGVGHQVAYVKRWLTRTTEGQVLWLDKADFVKALKCEARGASHCALKFYGSVTATGHYYCKIGDKVGLSTEFCYGAEYPECAGLTEAQCLEVIFPVEENLCTSDKCASPLETVEVTKPIEPPVVIHDGLYCDANGDGIMEFNRIEACTSGTF